MSAGLIAFVGVIYAVIAVEQFLKGSPANAIIFAGYAFANSGMWLIAK